MGKFKIYLGYSNQQKMKKSTILTCLILFAFFSKDCKLIQEKSPKPPLSAFLELVVYGWMELPKTKNFCPEFDYFPEGGMKSFYCHLRDLSSMGEVESYFGESIFLSGPHRPGFLILDDKQSFGHYNPKFPIFLRDTLIPAAKDKAFLTITQPIYDQYVKRLARVFMATYRKLQSNQIYFVTERVRYKKLIQENRLEPYYYEKFYQFMNPYYTDDENENVGNTFKIYHEDESMDGNVVKTCVAFWIRRSIDGTDTEFYEGLKLLVKTYDLEFYEERN